MVKDVGEDDKFYGKDDNEPVVAAYAPPRLPPVPLPGVVWDY